MPLVRIPIPNKVAWLFSIILAGFFGLVNLVLAATAGNTTNLESVLLVLAGLMNFYFLRWVIVYKWIPWGWSSLPEIVWNVVGIFTIFEIAKVIIGF